MVSVLDSPFWGAVTATIDWCEPNYRNTRFIAETANTISNLSFVLLGAFGAFHELKEKAPQSFPIMNMMLAAIGLASMLFHGSLTLVGQQLDELSMVWHLLLILHFINTSHKPLTDSTQAAMGGIAVLTYCVLFSAGHMMFKTTTAFQVHFGLLLGALMFRVYLKYRGLQLSQSSYLVAWQFVAWGLLGFTFWLIDYHFCDLSLQLPVNGHTLWHIFMGLAAYCSLVMLRILDAAERGATCRVRYRGPLPFAVLSKESRLESASKLSGDFTALTAASSAFPFADTENPQYDRSSGVIVPLENLKPGAGQEWSLPLLFGAKGSSSGAGIGTGTCSSNKQQLF